MRPLVFHAKTDEDDPVIHFLKKHALLTFSNPKKERDRVGKSAGSTEIDLFAPKTTSRLASLVIAALGISQFFLTPQMENSVEEDTIIAFSLSSL
ncbi:hypothetical protein QVD17_32804 [Tagetes erecta]|uniref:Uncharacterized protein n=1 Tax=Tagetes erecta TaxID=13708 RepID=A0AAD8JY29_TARER|nr:hypothetical protein QVD17_32804 [Tagetes erecta]